MGFMAVIWITAIIGIALLVWWLVAPSEAKARKEIGADSPLEILKKRYARGEINAEEFEQKKKDLGY
jgi:putative membrane protein